MTHEQKPESAEFRTRDRQIEIMTTNYMGAGLPIKAARKLATDEVTEAEARGAAEQRRKDAEGAEPIFQVQLANGNWRDANREEFNIHKTRGYQFIRQLYIRPANVGALEARVKELEEEVEQRIDDAVRMASAND